MGYHAYQLVQDLFHQQYHPNEIRVAQYAKNLDYMDEILTDLYISQKMDCNSAPLFLATTLKRFFGKPNKKNTL